MLRFLVLTVMPDMVRAFFSDGVVGRGIAEGLVSVEVKNLRDFSPNTRVDDAPFGGGAGMVMAVPPLIGGIAWFKERAPEARVVLLCPQGVPFTQARARRFADEGGDWILVCGRYEGIDERVRQKLVDEEISIGDFVLSGAEPAAACLIDAACRLVPGVLGNQESVRQESFEQGLLEYPQYTRPREVLGLEVPEVLLSGDHARIAAWRREQAIRRTRARRPDLLPKGEREDG
ncbi:MAG: tRNA (guanosine(37)-N1)-methyltransferase TrmD [Candidatus Methylomirabilis sp.]|nr:tRNA (guanosine(37)-N1)-methyltransferase TrmD [Deltaproteobacteria bacterium]